MNIQLVKHRNHDEGDRVEYLFVDFPYIDGNDLIAQYMTSLFGAHIKESVDGIYFKLIKIVRDTSEYNFVWHEDIGNYGYCVPQTDECITQFEKDLSIVINAIQNCQKDSHIE